MHRSPLGFPLRSMRAFTLLPAACAALFSLTASAATFSIGGQNYTTQFNTGSGNNHAMLVLGYSPTSNYLFGYSYGSPITSPTGLTMIEDVAAASGNTLQLNEGGGFISAITYTPASPTLGTFSWFGYFTSPDGHAWAFSDIGASDRLLTNGAWDAWVYQPNYMDDTIPIAFPSVTAVSPVPEPASLGLMAAGALLLLRRRR